MEMENGSERVREFMAALARMEPLAIWEAKEAFEVALITCAIERNGSISSAAEELGIGESTVRYYISKHKLKIERTTVKATVRSRP